MQDEACGGVAGAIPCSSTVEHSTVNRRVAGSNPAGGAESLLL